ncbi:TPA: recombinase family protein [Vibrio parahaemolyticus]
MAHIYSYRRVSTLGQSEGVSLEVQSDENKLRELSEAYSLPISERIYSDVGKSAYKGEQLENELGYFLESVHSGEIKAGSILVVYSLDRISRQNIGFAKQIYLDLTNNGVSIYSILDSHLYRAHNAADEILATIIFERANNESKTKGQRNNSTALKVIEGHLQGKRTNDGYAYLVSFGNSPWWIAHREDGAVIEHPVYWDVAKQVYQKIVSGEGNLKILSWLNDNFDAPKTRTNVKAPQRMSEWKFSTIANFHKQQALYGLKNVTINKNKPEQREFALDRYYPQLITESDWLALQAIKKKRRTADSTRKRYSLITGMGIAKCYNCGAVVAASMDKTKDVISTRYYCAGKRNLQNGCEGFSFKAKWVEKAILSCAIGHAFNTQEKDNTQLLALEGERDQAKTKLRKIKDLFVDDIEMMEEFVPQLKAIKNRIKELDVLIASEQREIAKIQEQEHLNYLTGSWNEITDDALNELNQDFRKKTRELVRDTFSKIEIGKLNEQAFCKATMIDGSVFYFVHNGKRRSNSGFIRLSKVLEDDFIEVKKHFKEFYQGYFVDEQSIKVDFDKVNDVQLVKV